jgi:tRNA threonylcarbamoyladenosine biosynthesis protein TsaB
MILLVTDTSGRQGSVALARAREDACDQDDPVVIAIAPLTGGTFSAQLVPQIASLLAEHGLSKADIEAFIVVSGPGSFTGVRVGLAAIKALAEVLNKPIVPVSLLEVLALATHKQGKLATVLDAGRGDVYFGLYEIDGDSVQVLREQLLSKAEFLSAARDSIVFTPDPAWLAAAREAGLSVSSIEPPGAEMILRFGWRKLRAGETVSPELLEANYMRRSDAEMFVKPSP